MSQLNETLQPCIAALSLTRPDVAIEVTRSADVNFIWDGDGTDPVEEGFYAYDVAVTAFAIRNGKMLTGSAYLGGCYLKPDEPIAEVHGYLPQMVEEATNDLDEAITQHEATA